MTSILKRGLAGLGYYLGRFPRVYTLGQHLAHVFSALGINCVLDVGAHQGGYGRRLRALGVVELDCVLCRSARRATRPDGDTASPQ
jgi:hypothetical protein